MSARQFSARRMQSTHPSAYASARAQCLPEIEIGELVLCVWFVCRHAFVFCGEARLSERSKG